MANTNTREYVEGYRITRRSDGVVIEVLDYHAGPLRLSVSDLVDLGLRIVEPAEPIVKPKDTPIPDHKPEIDQGK